MVSLFSAVQGFGYETGTGDIAFADIVSICPGGQSVYYLDRRDNCIWQQSFADGGKKKNYENPTDASNVNEIYVCNNSIYIMQYDPESGEQRGDEFYRLYLH